MSNDRRRFQREFFRALADRPLDLMNPDHAALYEPLHELDDDPVVRLHDTIDFSAEESVQIVAGFRGTGKTTEFSRLEKMLWESDYFVVRVDLDEYLDLHSPVHITEFLLVLSGAINERMSDEKLLGKGNAPSFWERVTGLLGSEVRLSDLETSVGPFGMRLGLKVESSVRERVRGALQGQLPRLVHEVRTHHETLLKALRERWQDDARLVVIVDSLEHIRGQGSQTEVFRAIQDLFFGHARDLQLPGTHMVLSVPASLALQADNLAAQFSNGAVQAWSSCRVRHRDGTPDTDTIERLTHLVERRGDWRKLLSPDQMQELVLASGGYLRDLLNMMVEAIHLYGQNVPEAERLERLVATQSRAYSPLYADHIRVLKAVAEHRSLRAVELEDQELVVRFLDSHLVLCYLDDDFWYDVHPLVRDRVLSPDA
ncbi:MAG: hypothetical protein EP330_16995 [Deltaproteobacteria bacterium]|nr:MAG: hypothetical protein EP330_16995 [Deltaproteobacteria bacterium]